MNLTDMERRIVELAMVRLVEWQAENPEGIIKEGPGAMRPVGRAFIEACIALQQQREQFAAKDCSQQESK